jgi:hypothetical protein
MHKSKHSCRISIPIPIIFRTTLPIRTTLGPIIARGQTTAEVQNPVENFTITIDIPGTMVESVVLLTFADGKGAPSSYGGVTLVANPSIDELSITFSVAPGLMLLTGTYVINYAVLR